MVNGSAYVMDEIVIKVERHAADLFKVGRDIVWFSYTIERDDVECLYYGLFFDSVAEAERDARDVLRRMLLVAIDG